MDPLVVAVRVLLAAVLTVASVGKLLDIAGSRRALAEFGVTPVAASIGGWLLPLVELATAVALALQPTARWGGVAALALFVAFVAGISNALAHGRTPDCNCFGALHSAPAGKETIARNVGLAVLAAVVIGEGPGPALDVWVRANSAPTLAAVVSGIIAGVLAAAVAHLWLANRGLHERLHTAQHAAAAVPPGLSVGAVAPEFSIGDEDGGRLTLTSLRAAGLPIALVFIGPGCGACEVLMPDLERWRRAFSDRLTIATVGLAATQRFLAADSPLQHGLSDELAAEIEELHGVFEAYKLKGTPSAVIVTPRGTIASTTVDGRPAIEALIRLAPPATARPADAAQLVAGAVAAA